MAEKTVGNIRKPDVKNESTAPIDGSTNKLNDISERIKKQKKELERMQALLKKTKSKENQNTLQEEIDDTEKSISQHEKTFELIITAGLLLNNVEPVEEAKFDWQKDLLEILQPIMNELHQLTAFKRGLNRIQKKISFFQSQSRSIKKALANMEEMNKETLNQLALTRFKNTQVRWQIQLEESQHMLEVAQLQYDEMSELYLAEPTIADQIKQFFEGRGITLVMTVAAFMLVFFSMKLLWRSLAWFRKQTLYRKKTYMQRVGALSYHIATVILSIAAVFYVLNVRNDQVLIGIAVLLIVLIIWALKNSIPHYVTEVQTFLNAGPVREGERIVYNGVPMKVGDLNFYTTLTNPALPGLILRLPLSDLLDYVSRQYAEDEPWFPCQQGDFVLLSDDTYGMVKYITLENVILSLSNGMMPKTYITSDFLAASPKNLSQGFLVTNDFGIDYKYQQNSTTQIPEIFREGIQQGLMKEVYSQSLLELNVRFSQANTSSLDYKIIAKFDGKAASDYYPIIRDLQRYAVEVCNQQQWEIPFAQLVVHRNSS